MTMRIRICGRFAAYDQAIRAWEASSAMQVDRAALKWWALFTCVKCAAIFTTGGAKFLRAHSSDLTYATISWVAIHTQERYMIDLMGVQK